ncbi:hypothetical protein [uncultured Streptomyces sp.]|uniref:hypothetical protein n=1 Tax=uncultured Streptomyces sp. TaxID=174707 RepID=UPI00261F450B|nr:hypothetical protein [uncultured Streptomyces sp.]
MPDARNARWDVRGGLSPWLELLEADSRRLADRAATRGLALTPGFRLSLDGACTGVWTMTVFGNAAVSRAVASCPRWQEPLSAIQKTRLALP